MDTERSSPGWVRISLWGLIAIVCALQAYEIRNRGIDPDELEHLHAAYCIWRGEVPYRDLFEHHGPALYYAMLPAFKICGPHLSALWLGRLAMWLCSLAALILTGRLARRSSGDQAGILAMALLAWTTIFHAKGIELRPDVPAALLLILGVSQFTFATGGGSWRRFLCVGLLAGLATLFTQKSIIPAAGIALAACLARLVTREPQSESAGTVLARVIIPFAAGVAAVWGTASLAFATAGAAGDFWYSTWYQLWIWPVRSSRWEYLRPTLAGDFTVWVAGLIEIVSFLKTCRASETWKDQRGVLAVVSAVCILSLTFVKATYAQYYLLWMPFLAVLAARRLVQWCERAIARRTDVAVITAGLFLAVMQSVLWQRAYWAGFSGGLPRLGEMGATNAPVLLTFAAVLVGIVALARRGRVDTAILLAAALGMGYGILRDIDMALWSNRHQVVAIEAINRRVPPDGRVLDGFTGYGALRPHEWYYWWINEYSLALIPPDVREKGLLNVLEATPPAAVLFDQNLNLLPPRVSDWIKAHYTPTDLAVLWVPREPDSPGGHRE